MLARYLRTVVLVWACEAVLARWTSDRQAVTDLLVSLAGLLAAGALPFAAALALRGAARDIAMAAACALPLAVVTAGILMAPAMALKPLFGPVIALAVVLLTVGGSALAAWHGRRGFPGPWTVPATVAGAAMLAWLLEMHRLPPGDLLAPLVGMWALAGVLAGGTLRDGAGPRITVPGLGVLLLLVGGFGVARLPDHDVEVSWRADLPDAAADAPDIVLLCVDTLRADTARDLAAWQRLAQEGTEFAQVQAAGPWTLPSMGTLMTGLPPWSHGAGTGEDWVPVGLAEETPTLGEQARGLGYDTAALVHNPVLSPGLGFRRGFEVWDSGSVRTAWALPHTRNTLEARPFVAHLLSTVGWLERRPFQSAEDLAARAETVLAARRAERPLLLWVHFLDCHFPFREAARLAEVPYARRMELERGDADRYRADPFWSSEPGRELLLRAYRHELEAVDAALLRILDTLGPPPERGRIVVLFSDHGEEFFEHGDVEHGHAFWQELLSVPLVVAGLPGRAPGEIVEEVVTHLDLATTLFDAIGAERPEGPPGQPLGAGLTARLAYSENLLRGARGSWDRSWAVRDGRWKYIFEVDGGIRVYDLLVDPGETEDLWPRRREAAEALPQRPDRVERSSARGGAGASRALNALGYVDD